MTGLFDIDSEGFISQQRGREPYEVIREALQNALDTGSDINVIVDYDSSTVIVKDNYEDGVENIEELWTLFDGDKKGDPTKRGRFGRGLKELVAASVRVSVRTTGGTVEFDVDNDSRTVNEDEQTEVGTEVEAHNPNWTNDQLTNVREFVNQIWVPDGIEITVESIRDGEERGSVLTPDKPEKVMQARLKTVTVDESGVMREEYRDTEVKVKRSPNGGIYEMGIPVTTQEDFPFILDVQQKIPMAEQRAEPKSYYRDKLTQVLLDQCLDLLDRDELAEAWVEGNITSHNVSRGVKDKYIRKRHKSPFNKGLVVGVGSSMDDFARQKAYKVLDVGSFSLSYSSMLENRLESSEDIYRRFEDEVTEEVDPTGDQDTFLNFIEDNIVPYLDEPVEIEFVNMEQDTETRAFEKGGVIKLNTANRAWDEINKENIGVVLHELAHTSTDSEEHDLEFIHDMQELAGHIILKKSTNLF